MTKDRKRPFAVIKTLDYLPPPSYGNLDGARDTVIVRLKWLGLKATSLFSKVTLLLTIAASLLWVPTSNFLLEMGCDQRGLCNTAFENFLWIWGIPIAATSIAFALWIIGRRAGEAANEVVR